MRNWCLEHFLWKCHETSLMMSRHRFRWWLAAYRQQTTIWANVGPDLCRRMASLATMKLKIYKKYICTFSPLSTLRRYNIWWGHQMEIFCALLALWEGNSPVNSPHKGRWRGALMLSLLCAWTNGWVDNQDAGDLRRNHAHHDVTVI